MQPCSICNENIVISGSLRPNTAVFECGHQFHLSCVLSYSKQRLQNTCPDCKQDTVRPFANFGEDRLLAMQALIDSRRRTTTLTEDSGGWSWFKKTPASLSSLVKSGKSLHALKLDGYLPEDMVEEKITWAKLQKTYTIEALLEFGFTYAHMKRMGFEEFKQLKLYQIKNLNITATDMMESLSSISQLAELNLPLHELHALGFTWKDLMHLNGNAETLRLLTDDLAELKTYFEPDSWEGFTSENIEKYEWDTSKYNPIKPKSRVGKIRVGNMVF